MKYDAIYIRKWHLMALLWDMIVGFWKWNFVTLLWVIMFSKGLWHLVSFNYEIVIHYKLGLSVYLYITIYVSVYQNVDMGHGWKKVSFGQPVSLSVFLCVWNCDIKLDVKIQICCYCLKTSQYLAKCGWLTLDLKYSNLLSFIPFV